MSLILLYKKKPHSSAEMNMLLGQGKISLQGQGTPGWQHPSIPAGTHSAASRGRWEQGRAQPPHPWERGLRVNAQVHTANLGGRTVMLRGHNCPCRACLHTGNIPTPPLPRASLLGCNSRPAGSREVTTPASTGRQPPGSCSHRLQEQAASQECANQDVFKGNRLLRPSNQTRVIPQHHPQDAIEFIGKEFQS